MSAKDSSLTTTQGAQTPETKSTLKKIRELWGKHLRDDEIRDVLNLTDAQWEFYTDLIRVESQKESDNTLSFEKYIAKVFHRADELQTLRVYAEATNELKTVIKCHELESKLDRELVEIGQKLGVLKPQVISIQKNVKHEHEIRIQALFANLDENAREQAKKDFAELHRMMITDGVIDTNIKEE